jgi:hypothetical protein
VSIYHTAVIRPDRATDQIDEWQVWVGNQMQYSGTYHECEAWLDHRENLPAEDSTAALSQKQ